MKYVIFDLDNTLYPKEIGLFKLVDQKINEYMKTMLGMDDNSVEDLRLKYMHKYGTTLGGLIRHHKVDPEEYLTFVHNVDLEGALSADIELCQLLGRIVLGKVIFTNGSCEHAINVLNILGVDGHFSRIFDIKFMEYIAKPNLQSYQKVLDVLGVEGRECFIVEDLAKNLIPAKKLGMITVLIGDEGMSGADFVTRDILGIEKIFKETGFIL